MASAPLLPLDAGTWQSALEGEATGILKVDRALHLTAISDKNDWLTEEQLDLRRDREVAMDRIEMLARAGLYRRVFNPLTGTRPVSRDRFSVRQDPWRQDRFEDDPGAVVGALPSYLRPDRLVESGVHYTWDVMLPNKVPRGR